MNGVNFSPSRAMNLLHLKMINRFNSKKVEQDKQNARDLQLFFQALKHKEAISADSGVDMAFIDQIKSRIKQQNSRINIDKLFYRSNWKTFEKEIARVQAATVEVLSGNTIDFKTQMTGRDVREGVFIDIDKVTPEILRQIGIKYTNKLNGFELPGYYVKGGQQIKIDNKNLPEIEVSAHATPYMSKIYNLLKDASFTAKNYGSESTQYHRAYENLSLGSTKISTILLDTLPYLTGSHWTYFLKVIALNSSSPEVMLHVQHLRQAYELVGLGQQSNAISKEHGGAKYLIYNDPSTDFIYVNATSAIVQSILESKFYRRDPFTSYITEISRDLLTVTATDYKQVL